MTSFWARFVRWLTGKLLETSPLPIDPPKHVESLYNWRPSAWGTARLGRLSPNPTMEILDGYGFVREVVEVNPARARPFVESPTEVFPRVNLDSGSQATEEEHNDGGSAANRV